MSLFDKLFNSKSLKGATPVESNAVRLHFGHEGIKYEFTANPVAISNGFESANETVTDQARRLSQLAIEGLASQRENEFSISWDSVYQLLADEDFASYVAPLGIPGYTSAVPKLKNSGALLDPSFQFFWRNGWTRMVFHSHRNRNWKAKCSALVRERIFSNL